MKLRPLTLISMCFALLSVQGHAYAQNSQKQILKGQRLTTRSEIPVLSSNLVEQGYVVQAFARNVGSPVALGLHKETGDIFTLDQKRGRVLRFRDRNADGESDMRATYLSGFDQPSGLAIGKGDQAGSLYVSDKSGVWVADISLGISASQPARLLADLSKVEVAIEPRPITLSAKGERLYLGLSPSNPARRVQSPPAASIVEINTQTGQSALYASGLARITALNMTGSGRLVALVDESAPASDYLAMPNKGSFYGWPYAYGAQIPIAGLAHKAPYRVASMQSALFSFGKRHVGGGLLVPRGAPDDGNSKLSHELSHELSQGLSKEAILITFKGDDPHVAQIDAGGIIGGSLDRLGDPILSGFSQNGRVWGEPSALLMTGRLLGSQLLVADRLSGTLWSVRQPPKRRSAPRTSSKVNEDGQTYSEPDTILEGGLENGRKPEHPSDPKL